ncbi:MAG: uroporphyrinogen decarboxylase family protein, partial [Kiritimatiellia bacterium]|nr:uroporphyrinogen decarboxylase family protein [Kiritimatiellia bacterium]
MTGKERLIRTLKRESADRSAWLPFVGCHGGYLIGRTAEDYLKSADLMVAGLKEARRRYRPDALPVAFDLQIEAEALGCGLAWAAEVPPSVVSHPLMNRRLSDLPASLPASAGRIPVVLEVMDRLKREWGDEVALYGLICGPFTLALHLRGSDIFLDMFDDEAGVQALLSYAADRAIEMAGHDLDHGADVIAVVDPMISQISPEHFEHFVTPHMNRVFDAIRARGGLSSLFVCGDVTRNLDVMCRTRADNISVDEQIDMARLKSLAAATGKSFGGNLKLTAVLLLGRPDDARRETVAVMDTCGDLGFVLSPGCDLPYATPPENLEAVADMALDAYRRDVFRAARIEAVPDSFHDIAVPDYESMDAVVLDVITL